jgi:hypothetical protein
MDPQDLPTTEQGFARLSLDRNPSPIPDIATLNPPVSDSSELTWSNPSNQEVSTDAIAGQGGADAASGEDEMSISDDEPVMDPAAGQRDKDERMSGVQPPQDDRMTAEEERDHATSASTGSKDQPKPGHSQHAKPTLGSPIRLKEKPVSKATTSSSSALKGSKEGKSNKSRGQTQDKAMAVSDDDSSGEPHITGSNIKLTGSSSAARSRPARSTKSRAQKQVPPIEVSSDNSETDRESDLPQSKAKGKPAPGAVLLGTKRISKSTMHGSLDSNITAPINLLDMIAVPVCHCSH